MVEDMTRLTLDVVFPPPPAAERPPTPTAASEAKRAEELKSAAKPPRMTPEGTERGVKPEEQAEAKGEAEGLEALDREIDRLRGFKLRGCTSVAATGTRENGFELIYTEREEYDCKVRECFWVRVPIDGPGFFNIFNF